MSGFNDWIYFSPTPIAAVDRHEEVDDQARATLAQNLQNRLRGRIDPGISADAALRAQAVRVRHEGDRLVIDQEDQGAVLAASSSLGKPQAVGGGEASSVEALFEPGSGVPSAVIGEDGATRLAYRTITLEALFGDQRQAEQDFVVGQTTTESLRSGIVEAYEDAVDAVNRRHPTAVR